MDSSLKTRILIILVILIIGCLLDQASKLWAITYLKDGPSYEYLNDFLRVGYAENRGAFLGLGQSLSEEARFWILTVSVGIFLLGLCAYTLFSRELNRWGIVSCSLLLSGGFSNFIDRAFNEGVVIDFLNLGFGGIRTGIFNIADMLIMAGAFMMVLLSFRLSNKNKS